jgi:PII-like signaling protein
MQGAFLKFYVSESAKHHGKLLYEWLLEEAQRIGIPGASAFRAIAGYGRHARMHEEHFFELAGDLPVMVEFFADESTASEFLERLKQEKISIFYIRLPSQGGITGS